MSELLGFRELYEEYAPHVRRFALMLTGNAALSDDLTQETFIRVWAAGAELRPETLKAYLFTITRNLYRNILRHESRHVDLDQDMVDPAPGAAAGTEERAEVARVLDALARLPVDDRAALAMRAFEGMSHADIAAALGCSVAAAKVRIHRARLKLARLARR